MEVPLVDPTSNKAREIKQHIQEDIIRRALSKRNVYINFNDGKEKEWKGVDSTIVDNGTYQMFTRQSGVVIIIPLDNIGYIQEDLVEEKK